MYRYFLIVLFAVLPFISIAQTGGGDYYIHTVGPKETIFSISRATGVKVKTIIELNPGFTKATKLALGQSVRLPKEKSTIVVLPDVNTGDNRHHIYEELETPVAFKGEKKVIALLLPFYAKESGFSESEGVNENRKIPEKSEQFMQFYEGVLLALDSLKLAGEHIDLQVYDIGRSDDDMRSQLQAVNALNPDLIIGPVYENQMKILCAGLQNKRVPVIYPLSSRSAGLENFENLIQVNISSQSLASEMSKWLRVRKNEGANIVYLTLSTPMNDLQNSIVATMRGFYGATSFAWDSHGSVTSLASSLQMHLMPNIENIIVVPIAKEAELSKVLPVLLLCREHYNISVVGLPDWQTFTLVDLEHFFKLNVTLFVYNYTDSSMPKMQLFSQKFRTFFASEPSGVACKGYDIFLFFGDNVCKYGTDVLRRLRGANGNGDFSVFRLGQNINGPAMENKALFKVTYGNDYKLHIHKIN